MRGDAPGDDAGATVAETSGDSATTPASAVTAASGSVTTGGSIATSGGEGASGVTWGDATAAETSGGSATTPAPAATAASGPATTGASSATPGSEGANEVPAADDDADDAAPAACSSNSRPCRGMGTLPYLLASCRALHGLRKHTCKRIDLPSTNAHPETPEGRLTGFVGLNSHLAVRTISSSSRTWNSVGDFHHAGGVILGAMA